MKICRTLNFGSNLNFNTLRADSSKENRLDCFSEKIAQTVLAKKCLKKLFSLLCHHRRRLPTFLPKDSNFRVTMMMLFYPNTANPNFEALPGKTETPSTEKKKKNIVARKKYWNVDIRRQCQSKFVHSVIMLLWNNALWFVKRGHITIFNQSDFIILE